MNNTSTPEGKNLAIVAYITFIGMFIAYSINRDKKQAFVTAHIKNMCGLVFWASNCPNHTRIHKLATGWYIMVGCVFFMGVLINSCATKQTAKYSVPKWKVSTMVYFFRLVKLTIVN